MRLPRTLVCGLLAASTVALTACTADPVPQTPAGGSGSTAAPAAQELDQALHDRLPEHIRQAGKIVAVNTGSFPPYTIVGAEGTPLQGASAELSVAVGQILGVEIEHETIDGLASVLSGMQAQRYDLDMGPVGDFPERQQQA
ncbi:MAG: transporter substrate-binding domain-containing protein, partial [Pseudonocardia sp.]